MVNDINANLVGLYRNLQFHLPALLHEIEWLFASRKNLHDFIAQPGLTELQRAARFILVNRTSFGSNMQSFRMTKTQGGATAFNRDIIGQFLKAAHRRLNGVVVENIPYERCLALYDSPETFFFIDPPYLNANPGKTYSGWSEKQMREFRDEVARLKGKWIVTVDDSSLNRELFADCRIKRLSIQNGLRNRQTDPNARFGELVITPK